MADIFVSYAREDRDQAAQLAGELGKLGWSVWWDRKIIAGQAFDDAIERELESAKCVIVLWSRHSIGSEWVRNEAADAAQRGVLVPATIESVKLPLEFRRRHTADLTGWRGDPSNSGFEALREGVNNTIGGAPMPEPKPPPRPKRPWYFRGRWLAVAVVAVIVGIGGYVAISSQMSRFPRYQVEPAPAPAAAVAVPAPGEKTKLPKR